MDISSLLNTDLGNLNDKLYLKEWSSFLVWTIDIFLKSTCPICQKTKAYFLIKQKHFFKTKDLARPVKRRLLGLLSRNTQTGDLRHQTVTVNWFETINYFALHAFMIRSMIILTFILCSNFSALSFKFKEGFTS